MEPRLDDLVVARPQGLYCPPGDFYIDPWQPVADALITHAHGDHLRMGHGRYLTAEAGRNVVLSRVGPVDLQTLAYGETLVHRGVTVSFHPAGHVLGSAQIRLEYKGRVWVVSGDYKTGPDPTCEPFEPVRCNVFVTESTFGLPVFRWAPQQQIFDAINAWWQANADAARASVVYAYSFGKAQRVLAGLDPRIGPVIVHGAVATLNAAYRESGVALPAAKNVLEATPDAAWALYFLAGGKPRQTVPTALVRAAARECANIPQWLFDESYDVVGDLAETVAHVLPPPTRVIELPLHAWMEERLLALRGQAPEAISAALKRYWDELDTPGRFLLTKLIGGSFRVGVARSLVVRALAEASGLDAKLLAQRLMGYTDKHHAPAAARFTSLLDPERRSEADSGQPYPFFLAHPLQAPVEQLGDRADWQVEWKWDGIRAQFIRRGAGSWLWSRGEDLLNGRFPELDAMHASLPDRTVLDGEIVVWREGRVRPFAELQKRIGRTTVTKKILARPDR